MTKQYNLRRPVERFIPKVKMTDSCWLWLGAKARRNYGAFWDGKRQVPAHVFAFKEAGGIIPEGMVLDHICKVHECVNPSHLRVVTPMENTIFNSDSIPARQVKQTHCKRGHAFTPDNLESYALKNGLRKCLECTHMHQKNYKLAKKHQVN